MDTVRISPLAFRFPPRTAPGLAGLLLGALLLLTAVSAAAGTSPGLARKGAATAPPAQSPCRGCHDDLGKRLPPGHENLTGRSLTLCVSCHRAEGVAAPLMERIHAAHESSIGQDCAQCHTEVGGTQVLITGPPVPARATNAVCLACHQMASLAKKRAGLSVPPAHLDGSAHARLACTQCHAAARSLPHAPKLEQVRCDGCHQKPNTDMPKSVHAMLGDTGASAGCVACHGAHQVQPVATDGNPLCTTCHRGEAMRVAASIHATARGDGKRNLPTCTTCHTAHAVKSSRDPASPTSRAHIHETCATCHADPKVIAQERIARPRVIALFEQSIHGRAIREKGKLDAATCTDCHGGHEIRRAADPGSGWKVQWSGVQPRPASSAQEYRTCGED